MKILLLTLMFLAFHLAANGQTFSDVSLELGISHSYTGGEYAGGCSFYDFNRDGLEDISLPSADGSSKFYLGSEQGEFSELIINEVEGEVKCIIWVDYDNDGDSDLSYTQHDGQFYLLENTGNLTFIEVDLNISANIDAPNTGISWADYDNDGFLDFFVARYNSSGTEDTLSTSRLIKNNGDGTFSDQTNIAGVNSGFTSSFLGSWFDYNQDGYIDLHVANDKFIFDNELYENNGDGTFTDVTFSTGANINIDCMTNTVGDYNNDGDLDLYLSNGEAGNHLLRASGTEAFQDLFPDSGTEMYQFCWGANWFDYDHNGWKDLYVCSEDINLNNGFFVNLEGDEFERTDELFPLVPKNSFSAAKGDFDKDGLYDLLVLNEDPYQTSLFQNTFEGGYRFVSVALTGTVSNKDAIGTRLDYYVNGSRYTELTHAGTDYMSQDSQYKLLSIPSPGGLIDSLVITWPRGLKETHYNLISESYHNFVEGTTLSYSLSNAPLPSICEGETTSMEILAESDSVVWSNGLNNSLITITEPGTYSAIIYFGGYEIQTEQFTVSLSPSAVIDSLSITPPLCFGESSGQALIYTSSSLTNEALTPYFIDSLPVGNFFPLIEIEGLCPFITNIPVEGPSEMFTLTSVSDPLCYADSNGSVSFTPFGGAGEITSSLNTSVDPEALSAGIYHFTSVDANGCLFTDSIQVIQPDSLFLEFSITDATENDLGALNYSLAGGTEPYTLFLNGIETTPQALEQLMAGEYCFSVIDANGCALEQCFTVSTTIHISEILSSEVLIYPNPASNELVISSIPVHTLSIDIVNSLGEIVLYEKVSEAEIKLDVSEIARGVYYVRCNAKSEPVALKKLILN